MYIPHLLLLALTALSTTVTATSDELQIENTVTNDCKRRTAKGDTVAMHYRGRLASDGSQFDASYDRGSPLVFALGTGRVIRGWDEGLIGMCPGDKRTLTIPPDMAYGKRAMGPIPADSTLIFDTELVEIKGVKEEL